ncbi:MAG: RNA polymerase sigma factor [Clostridia bacterium]|nr:RNA polymerase sigma factor [Clostridia bacterium]
MSIIQKKKNDFNEVYDSYADMLFRLSLSYVRYREDAEDIVQEVFVSYITNSPPFFDEGHRQAWLIKVTMNKCRDLARHKSIRQHLSYDEIGDVASDDEVYGEGAELFAALEALQEQYRVAVMLHYFEGFSVEEIAKILSISVSGVKMRLSRGRRMLKELLQKEG